MTWLKLYWVSIRTEDNQDESMPDDGFDGLLDHDVSQSGARQDGSDD